MDAVALLKRTAAILRCKEADVPERVQSLVADHAKLLRAVHEHCDKVNEAAANPRAAPAAPPGPATP